MSVRCNIRKRWEPDFEIHKYTHYLSICLAIYLSINMYCICAHMIKICNTVYLNKLWFRTEAEAALTKFLMKKTNPIKKTKIRVQIMANFENYINTVCTQLWMLLHVLLLNLQRKQQWVLSSFSLEMVNKGKQSF